LRARPQRRAPPRPSTGDALTALARAREAAFDARFESTFPTGSVPASLTRHALSEASKAALSNLLGSMGYFVGSSLVKLPPGVKPPRDARLLPPPPGAPDASVVRYWREALFTAVPSRSFFPRGFLWDEGFHQLLVARWDAQLCRDALSHWLDLMNARGWVPREQILGAEARARVPSEFLVQHPEHANPPSLYLPLLALAAVAAPAAGAAGAPGAAGGQAAATRAFRQRAWPRLEAWYGWFNTTQAGLVPGSYMCAAGLAAWRRSVRGRLPAGVLRALRGARAAACP
jgi:mannosyl-oligosaccharide glucosidase